MIYYNLARNMNSQQFILNYHAGFLVGDLHHDSLAKRNTSASMAFDESLAEMYNTPGLNLEISRESSHHPTN